MSQLQPDQRVVAEGTLLYDGMVECDIRIVFGPICYGCGAFDEETELHEDVVDFPLDRRQAAGSK